MSINGIEQVNKNVTEAQHATIGRSVDQMDKDNQAKNKAIHKIAVEVFKQRYGREPIE